MKINGFTLATATAVPTGTFVHVAGTYDGSNVRLFVNGAEAAAAALTENIATNSGQVARIGNDNTGTTLGFVRLVDNVAVWNRALSAAEIAGLANPGHYIQIAGTTSVNATLTVPNGITLSGGSLTGNGTVLANVQNHSVVGPGNSPDILDIVGDYTQSADGTLLIEMAGRDPDVPQFDQLRVTGTATLDGTVRVELLHDFEPTPGNDFRVLIAALRIGEFATHDLPYPGGIRRQLTPIYYPPGLPELPGPPGLLFQTQIVPPLDFIAATTGGVADGQMSPRGVVLDRAGNAFVTGSFSGTVDFDREHAIAGDTLTSTGTDGFVGAYDATGQLLWVSTIDGGGDTFGSGIAIDHGSSSLSDDDLIYVTGGFAGTARYAGGLPEISTTGSQGGFLLQVDSDDGALGVFTALPDAATVAGNRLAVAPNGNVLIAGEFSGTMDLGVLGTLVSAGSTDAFVLETSPGGAAVRAGRLGSSGIDRANDVAVRSTGELWLSGDFTGTATGLATLVAAGNPADSNTDAFLLKLSASGSSFDTDVSRRFGGDGDDTGQAVATDALGNVILGGNFEFSVDFDVDPALAFTLHSSGDRDLYLVKLAADGAFLWARAIGGFRDDLLADLATDSEGNIYSTGEFRDRVDFDPLDGFHLLATSSETNSEAFLSKLDSAGRFVWAAQLGDQPGAMAHGSGLDVADDGRVASVGEFQNTVDFDPTDLQQLRTFTPSTPNEMAGYLSLLQRKPVPRVAIGGLPAGSVLEGTTLALAAQVTDDDSIRFDYSWTVLRDGNQFATGNRAALAAYLLDQGVYTIQLVVKDESGNTDSVTETVVANNAAPVIQPQSFAAGTKLLTTSVAGGAVNAGDNLGGVLAVGNGLVLVGSTGASEAWLYDPAGSSAAAQVKELLSLPAGTVSSVAILGNRLIVGAANAGTAGAVYVYERDASTGELSAGVQDFLLPRTLTGPDPVAGDRFGASIAPIGDLLVIGAPGRTTIAGTSVGEAYLYDPATGQLVQTYRNPTPTSNDEFAAALAAVGGRVLIGAPGDDKAGLDTGAVHLFDPNTGGRVLEILNPTPGAAGDRFGAVLAATGLRALVGDPADATTGASAGGVYLYDLDANSARYGQLTHTLRSPNSGGGRFGSAIAVEGNRALIGAEADGQGVANSGSAFLFDIDPVSATFGTRLVTLKKPTPVAGDRFAAAIALVASDVIIGAPGDDVAPSDETGGVYRFAAATFISRSSASVAENGTVTVSASFADPGARDTHTAVIDWGDGTAPERIALVAGVSTFSRAHQYLDDNPTATAADVANIRVRVQDDTVDVLAAKPASNLLNRYDGSTLEDFGAFVAGGSGGLAAPSALAVGPDGDVYVSSGSAGANPVLRFSGVTGDLVGTFIVAGSQGTTSAADLSFGPDGNLYYLDGPAARVLRYDGLTGVFLDVFVASGSGGLSDPRGIAFGPDGHLYVANFGSDTIPRYDGQTGTPIDTFASSADGIDDPLDLVFSTGNELLVLTLTPVPAVFRFDAATGESLGTLANPPLSGMNGALLLGANDGLFVADPGGPLRCYDTITGIEKGQTNTNDGALAGLPPQAEATAGVTITTSHPRLTFKRLLMPPQASTHSPLSSMTRARKTRSLTFGP
jgi:hypothetical protein